LARVRLSDEDRERIGLEQEWIDWISLDAFMVTDAMALDEAGYGADRFAEEIRGIPLYRDGEPVMVEDDDGTKVQQVSIPARAMRAAIWLAARRTGWTGPLSDFDFRINGITFQADEEPAGKGPGTKPASARSSRSTRSRSSKSSASGRGRSNASATSSSSA